MKKLENFVERSLKKYNITYEVYSKLKGLEYEKPDYRHDLFCTGFRRSGNTYAVNLIKNIFPEINLVSHIHTISSIKKAMKYNLPIAVHFRNPVDTIISAVLKNLTLNKNTIIENEVRRTELNWIDYYKYCLNNYKNINFIDFELLTKDPYSYAIKISQIINKPEFYWEEDLGGKVFNSMYNNDNRKGGAKNLRSEEKKELILIYKDNILKNINIDEVNVLYDQLKNKSS